MRRGSEVNESEQQDVQSHQWILQQLSEMNQRQAVCKQSKQVVWNKRSQTFHAMDLHGEAH